MTRLCTFLFTFLCLAPLLAATAAWAQQPEAVKLPDHLVIEAPTGWSPLPGLSKKLSRTASLTSYFGDEPVRSGAVAYGRANQGALYLTWVDSTAALASPEAALRSAFDDLHEAPFLASTEAGAAQEILYRERSANNVRASFRVGSHEQRYGQHHSRFGLQR